MQAALNLLMYRLQGRVYDHTVKQAPARKGKPGPKPKPKKERPNLFDIYGIEPWTLHDARRTMTTFLDDKRLGGAATAILGHKTDHDRVDERERMASVTDQHYNRSQRIGLKAEGMALWVKALLAAYQKERRSFATCVLPPSPHDRKRPPRPTCREVRAKGAGLQILCFADLRSHVRLSLLNALGANFQARGS